MQDRFIEFSWIETYIHKYVDREPQLMFSIFEPSKCMHTENRSDGTSNLHILYICWNSGVYIHKMYGHILTRFEECICEVSEVNKGNQNGDNTRTNMESI